MENSNDRRVRRTKKQLVGSLTRLMMDKPVNKITVTELTELADVNRSTFYLYYRDIFDMLDKIETEIIEEFQEALKRLYLTGSDYDNIMDFFLFIFDFIKKNEDFCKVIFSQKADSRFLNRFKAAIIESQPPYTNRMKEIGDRYFMPFVIAGCIGAIQQWIDDDMRAEPKEIAVFIIDLISNGVMSLKENDPL